MLKAIVVHWGIDMMGALSLGCILGICKNPDHRHGRIISWMGRHPWITQMTVAIPVAILMVVLIDGMLLHSGHAGH